MRLHKRIRALASWALLWSTWAGIAAAQDVQPPPAPAVQSNSQGSSQSRDRAVSDDRAVSEGIPSGEGTPGGGEQLEEVVVTGIRASLDKALDTKRESAGFVDAINAEDVGKLPDENVAEALQRVTGVAIQRSRGEGDFVSIRGLGPNFVRGTINNRSLVSSTESRDATRSGGFESSTGRETNFDLLPAEMIASIEVIKSPSASQVEGGIGGVVDIKTQHPLALGTTAVASARGTYRDFNKKLDPSASGLASWSDASKTFGVLGAIAYSERTIREDDPDSFGYTLGAPVDTDGNGTGDRTGVSFPFSFNPQSFTEKRKRLTLQGSTQWVLPDESKLTVDALYSKRDLTSRAFVSFLGTCCNFQGAFDDVTNPDGSVRLPGIQIAGNTAVGFPVRSQVSDNSDDQTVNDRLYSVGANYDKTLGDWDLGVDLAYSRSRGELDFTRVSLLTYDTVPFMVSESHDQLQVSVLPGGPDLTNAASYRTNNVDVVDRFNRDHEFDADLGATRKLADNGVIGAIRFGGHYAERNVDREDHTNFNVNTDQVSAALLPANGFRRFDGNFANGTSSYPMGTLLFGDWAAQTALLKSKNPNASFDAPFSPLQSFLINEKTTAAYVQADIDSMLAGIAIKGNAGVRFVHTKTVATGLFQPFEIDNDPNNNNLGKVVILDPHVITTDFDNSYNNVLPMMNLRAQLMPDLYLRFAAGRSVTRPTFLQMSPGLSNINPTQRFANSGNPNLKAYQANNYDLGLEWYFGKGNAVYASVFRKDIDNFIGVVTNLNVDKFGVNFRSLSQPENQGNAHITGEEIGVQQTLGLGLGYILNATFIDSSAHFTEGTNAGKTIPFEGVSRTSYNATLFYEKAGFSTRLSYSGRSSYVLLSSDVFANRLIAAPYGQLDGSISYTFDQRWTIFANGINLGGAADRIYSDTTLQPLSWAYVGRRYELGMKARL